ncbi:hypothetical protein BDR06DRAFT_951395, partial [Suillus hirtellus]
FSIHLDPCTFAHPHPHLHIQIPLPLQLACIIHPLSYLPKNISRISMHLIQTISDPV